MLFQQQERMFEVIRLISPFLFIILTLPLLLLIMPIHMLSSRKEHTNTTSKFKSPTLPKAYPIIGHLIAFCKMKEGEWFEWLVNLVVFSPSGTFVLHGPFENRSIYTGDPAAVEHILKTHFPVYERGPFHKALFKDLFGGSLLSENGENWKFQRRIVSHAVTPKALQHYLDNILDFELSERLIPILSEAVKSNQVLDLQDIFERFALDNICMVGSGYDPVSLSSSFPHGKLCKSLNNAANITFMRVTYIFPIIWKICRLLNVKHEKRLKDAVADIREFVASIVEQKRQDIMSSSDEEITPLSRLLKHDHLDDELIIDMVIAFIYAGRDTTSATLTWFFWLLHNNKHVEEQILQEIKNYNERKSKIEGNKSYSSIAKELKQMVYTRAALNETMRLYPPVPLDPKQANRDDVLPDGTPVKKGTLVYYFPYVMGRMKKIWGSDWSEFRPERWLEKQEDSDDASESKWRFVDRDPYSYPVFQAGPRICIGKEMAYLQMTKVVIDVLGRFEVVPTVEDGFNPVYVPAITSKMRGGLPVRIQERAQLQ